MDTQIVIRITNEDKEKLKVLAKIHKTSISNLIRMTISQLNNK